MRAPLAVLIIGWVFSFQSQAQESNFIYPEMIEGQPSHHEYDFSSWGRGTHNGYISVFNLERRAVESLLPDWLGLASNTSSQKDFHPVIIVWGEISEATASYEGIDWPSSIKYREWQLYVPGVYRKSVGKESLFTFVPRIFVDNSLAKNIGERFYYRKILADMHLNMGRHLVVGDDNDWLLMQVKSDETPFENWKGYALKDDKWRAIFSLLPDSDIMGSGEPSNDVRCSGFAFRPTSTSRLRPVKTSMDIFLPLLKGMDPTLLNRSFESVASYEVRDWHFYVDYYFNFCR
jgi:hypothetical protein